MAQREADETQKREELDAVSIHSQLLICSDKFIRFTMNFKRFSWLMCLKIDQADAGES